MAFKIGDKVKSKVEQFYGTGEVLEAKGGDEYVVKFADGSRDVVFGKDLVLANSRSCNAKVYGKDKNGKDITWGVKARWKGGRPMKVIGWDDYRGMVSLDEEGYGELFVPPNEIEVVNSCAKNACAKNAKFKVGDRVAYYGNEKAIYRKRGKVSDVSQVRGETFVTVDLDDGEEWGAPEKDWAFMNSLTSSIPAVNAALNACAKNLKVGDKVKYAHSRGYDASGKEILETKTYLIDGMGRPGYVYLADLDGRGNGLEVRKSDIRPANSCGIRSTNAAVNAALNGCKARNADKLSKRFGDVEVLAFEDGRLGIRYVITLGGFDEFVNAVSWDDAGKKCAAEARQMASLFEKRAASIKQAASWLEQNAK